MYLFIVGKSFQIISFYAFICFLHIKNPSPSFYGHSYDESSTTVWNWTDFIFFFKGISLICLILVLSNGLFLFFWEMSDV